MCQLLRSEDDNDVQVIKVFLYHGNKQGVREGELLTEYTRQIKIN